MSLSKRTKYALLAACVAVCLLIKLSIKQWIVSVLSLVLGYLLAHHLTVKRQGSTQSETGGKRERQPSGTTTTSFENQFRRAHPWQSVYLTDNVDKSLEELMSLVVQNFVLSWYTSISGDDGFVFELKCLIRHSLACLVQRAKKIDFGPFLTQQVNTILFNHVHDFHKVMIGEQTASLSYHERLAKQSELFKQMHQVMMEQSGSSSCHVAMWSRRHELAYLRQVCKRILPFILPDNVIQSRVTLELIEEIIVSNLLLKTLDVIAEPETINKLVAKAIESHYENKMSPPPPPPTVTGSLDVKQVQILKHWCHMNGAIFRSIQAPSFKETIENDEIMHIFINYLNSTSSISVLQLYLMLKDMIKSYNTSGSRLDEEDIENKKDDQEEEENVVLSRSNLLRQIEELRVWCESNRRKLEAISFSHELTYYAKLTPILSNTTTTSSVNQQRRLLGEIFADLTILLKDVYYLSFVKSEYMYKNLIGLNKLVSTTPSSGTCSTKSSLSNQAGKLAAKRPTFHENTNDDSILIEDYFGSNHQDEPVCVIEDDLVDDDQEEDEEYAKFEQYNKMTNRVESSNNNNLVNMTNEATAVATTTTATYESARAGSDIRFDLINEINDEFNEQDSPRLTVNNQQLVDASRHHLDEQHYEEGDEEEEEVSGEHWIKDSLNLNNLRIAIDEIDEVMDKSSQKTCYVFVIKVWHLADYVNAKSHHHHDDDHHHQTSQPPPSWSVRRKYDEFYVLDSRLKEFHGGLITSAEFNVNNPHRITVQLPAKQRAGMGAAIFNTVAAAASVGGTSGGGSNSVEFLDSVRDDFAKYLQSLLANPILSMSQLIKAFLDPQSIEFSSSILNDISSLGKMVKGVPYKLRVERGQSLDTFLQSLCNTLKQVKHNTKSTGLPVTTTEPVENILEKRLQNEKFKMKTTVRLDRTSNNTLSQRQQQEWLVRPFETFIFLIKHIYKLPDYACLVVFSLGWLIQKPFDYLLAYLLDRKMAELAQPDSLENIVRLLKDVIFGEEQTPGDDPTQLYTQANQLVNKYVIEELLGILIQTSLVSSDRLRPGVEAGTRDLLEAFQYPLLNKNVTYQLLDALIRELFPELDSPHHHQVNASTNYARSTSRT